MERKFDKKGYVLIYKLKHLFSMHQNGWILEHRVIVENFIGRRLKSPECIHHIDQNKTNNNIDNLMIFANHKDHAEFHNKMKKYGYLTNPMKRQINNRWKKHVIRPIGLTKNNNRMPMKIMSCRHFSRSMTLNKSHTDYVCYRCRGK